MLSPRKARQLVQAFAALPRELTDDMDAAEVAEEIRAAVKSRNRPDLLPAASARPCGRTSPGPGAAICRRPPPGRQQRSQGQVMLAGISCRSCNSQSAVDGTAYRGCSGQEGSH
jgi:hypothetical protein